MEINDLMKKLLRHFVLLSVCLTTLPAMANLDRRTMLQRQMFQDAELALEKGQLSKYKRLKKHLHDYPLYPYLQFDEIAARLHLNNDKDVNRFLQQYPGTPLASRLQYKWLKSLARKRQWGTLIDNFYYTRDIALQCDFARALYKHGQTQRASAVLEGVWLHSKSLPKNCDAPLKTWQNAGGLSQELVWERIRLVMQTGRVQLALYLADFLNKADRYWVRIWAKVRRDPDYVMHVYDRFKDKDSRTLRWILSSGLTRMARNDAPSAAQLWHLWRDEFQFDNNEKERTERKLALALAREDPINGQKWLESLKLNVQDPRLHELYIISAIQDQDWETALDWIKQLPQPEQHSERWVYWRGRAQEALGQTELAHATYMLNANTRGYYGFLAADRAGMNYQLDHHPVKYSQDDLATLAKRPAIERARELHALKRMSDARREWNYALQHMDKSQILIAAQLAHEWDWYDRAIITFAQAEYWDDLEKRFPLAHQDIVIAQAKLHRINPAWAFAVIRQESAFITDARSHAGALGLMQLLPGTARQMAGVKRMRFHRNDLLNVSTNVKLGISYLKHVKDRFKGNNILATAAYNAGDHRVKQWLPKDGFLEADVWIEKVPFSETRKYLKRVLTYTVIYEQRLGLRPVPLIERMLPIPARPTKLSDQNKSKTTS